LVGEGVSWESIAVAFEEKDVEPNLLAHVGGLGVVLDHYFLSENAEQGLLLGIDEISKNGFPEFLACLENILETGVLLLGGGGESIGGRSGAYGF
jgi:hypothetical protein